MGKYIFLGINSILVMLFSFFAGDDVTIKHNLPGQMNPGSEMVAEFTVKKGTVSGFGKIQIDLPAGFTASEVESLTGKFTFENNQAKILWIQLPKEEEFTVKIKIKVSADANGPKTVTGKFLFVEGNEKKQADMAPFDIIVSSANAITTNTVTPVNTTTVTTVNTETTSAVTSNTVTNTTGTDTTKNFSKPDEPVTSVIADRKITKEPNGTYRVDIKIKKGQIKGFAKYMDVLPDGLTASKGEIMGSGNFKFFEHKASVIWPTLPKEDEITASYFIKVTGTFTSNPVVTGVFNYLENDQTAKVAAKDAVVEILNTTPVETNTVVATNTVTPTNTTAVTNTVTPTETVSTTNTVVATETVASTNTVTPTNTVAPTNTVVPTNVGNSSVNFLVQIGAYKNAPDAGWFSSKYNISEKVSTDMHEGLTKFLVGKFQDYKSSRDLREKMKTKGVADAFVTAYNSGKRITVQEGLMITQQKWFK